MRRYVVLCTKKPEPPTKTPAYRHDATPWTRHNRALLCQATLSIGPYLLLKVQFQHYFSTPHMPDLNLKSRSPEGPRPKASA